MLGFCVDMVNSYGKEMKTLVDKDFINTMINNVKAFKIKKYEIEISQQEQVIII